jgi:hypothetical protein
MTLLQPLIRPDRNDVTINNDVTRAGERAGERAGGRGPVVVMVHDGPRDEPQLV